MSNAFISLTDVSQTQALTSVCLINLTSSHLSSNCVKEIINGLFKSIRMIHTKFSKQQIKKMQGIN